MRRISICGLALCGLLFGGSLRPAASQGLLWHLPPDQVNFTVLYYGTFTQKDISTGAAGVANEPIVWHREIIVKSLKREDGYYMKKKVPCRWIEISVRTGKFDEDIDTGPAGKRVYKILVPESKVVGDTKDKDTIFVSMIPIATDKDGKVMGVKKIGNANPVRMKNAALHIYPLLSLLHHYRERQSVPGENALTIAGQQVSPDGYKKFTSSRTIESRSRRSVNKATVYFSNSSIVPTRLAKWDVTVTHNTKNSSQPRSAFTPTFEFTESMTARTVTRDNAESQLPEPGSL